MFQSEISIAEHRGFNVGLYGFLFCFGLASSSWAALGAYFFINPSLQWMILYALQCVPAVFLLYTRHWLPESPRWLILKNEVDQAFDTLCKLHDTPGTLSINWLRKNSSLSLNKSSLILVTTPLGLVSSPVLRRDADSFLPCFSCSFSKVMVLASYTSRTALNT